VNQSVIKFVNEVNIIIAYGSNLTIGHDGPSQQFEAVVKALVSQNLSLKSRSSLWSSEAWPDPNDPPFVNAVLHMKTSLTPQALMSVLKQVERDFGRRPSFKNAPRPIDLDIIFFGDLILRSEELIIPHPLAHERGFVMAPLNEIAPDWIHPLLNENAFELWQKSKIGSDAKPFNTD
jgi:2-amino-4-hydroxy-6-hydroxymethyldihydropteridine diphosphokinase